MEERIQEGFPGQRLTVLPPAVARRCRSLPVVQDLYVTDIGHFPSAAHHYVYRPEGIETSIVIYCTDGAGWCELESQRWEVHEGWALFIPAGTPHIYAAAAEMPWSICWAHFAGTQSSSFLKALDVSPERPLLYAPDTSRIVAAFEEVYGRAHHGYSDVGLLTMSTSLSRWMGLLKGAQRAPHSRGRHNEEKILQSIQYMREHLYKSCQLAELAEVAQLSPSHYSYLFKQQLNVSPGLFFIRLKMQRACELLDMTNLAVAEIAEQVGYDDPYHFSRMFKKVFGKSPSSYRKMVKG